MEKRSNGHIRNRLKGEASPARTSPAAPRRPHLIFETAYSLARCLFAKISALHIDLVARLT